jgi:Spy/CpxP family protein refolding chaperone
MTSRNDTTLLVVLLLAATALAAAPVAAASAAAAAPPAEPGAWQTHQLEFQFVGFTTTYSCDGLESKLRVLLGRLGARPGFSVETYGCARGFGMPDRFARARLSFATLAPTPLGAAPAAGAAPGSWKSVAFEPHHPFELDTGDCELVEQFRDQLLPLFNTRAVQNQVRCVPHESPASFSLRFEVFAPPGKA